jgi:hypothetical protein
MSLFDISPVESSAAKMNFGEVVCAEARAYIHVDRTTTLTV